jgi:putative membrane protein
MASTLLRVFLALNLLTFVACSSNSTGTEDPVAAARASNEKRIDTADITEKQETDANFMVNATSNALLNIELGKLAQQQGGSAVVKAYGPRLVQQRLELLRALQGLATAKQLTVPADLGEDARAAYHDVSTQTGSQLDKELLKLIVKTQKQDEDAFDDMQDDAYDGDIRGLAAKYLPVVKEQLEAAKEVEDQVADMP